MYKLFIIVILSIAAIFILYAVSDKPNAVKNGFNRKRLENKLRLEKKLKLNTEWVRIVEVNDGFLLFSQKRPGWFLKYNLKTGKAEEINFRIDEEFNAPRQFRNVYRNGMLFIMAMNIPCIYTYNLATRNYRRIDLPAKFLESNMINEHTAVLRLKSVVNDTTKLHIAKLSLIDLSIAYNRDILQSGNDAGFSTSGILAYDPISCKIVFTRFYNNDILCMDTNLNVSLRTHTIDTFTTANVEVKGNSSNGYIFTKPPMTINKKSTFWNDTLYNMSSIEADNDNDIDYQKYLVLDLYNMATGEYIGSHYIGKKGKHKIRDFRVQNSKMVILYDGSADIYLF